MAAATATFDTIFCAAIEIASAEDRAAYIARACGGDVALQDRVTRLVAAHFHAGDFLEAPVASPAATVEEPVRERPGTVIGPYKLMEQIGEGGMGLVFVAEQQQPVSRKVALKVIKPGMDTRQVIARFEAERQALALMDHPNIAKVHDGGETENGRPYFVMELVKGVPITEYCDQNELPVRERLELFVHVCQAVRHAHQKGVIHRDIKPSNVLVMSDDGRPLVKVIDFGVAKAMGQQLTDKTIYTQFTQMVGTPLYMSPEQAGQSGRDVDTRTDIYALGVLLYELLTGATPFDKERLKEVDFDEMRRIIREEEPPKPSTRISTMGQAATTACTKRKSDPGQLSRSLRGELDWIVMKALEKDRDRRYESASAFAADVQRFLADEPVQACSPSAWYRMRKFARRNRARLAFAVGMVFLVAVIAASVGWAVHDRAVRKEEQQRQRAARRAETERAVTAATIQAETLLDEGDKQIDHPEHWLATARLAEKAVERAEELAATGEPAEDLAERLRQTRAAVDLAVAESRLLVELARLELEAGTRKKADFDPAAAAAAKAKAFGEYGLHLAAPEAAAARVRAARQQQAIVCGLEDWLWLTRDPEERRGLQQVLVNVEGAPDSFRARWRAAARKRDGAALVRLAGEPQAQALLPGDVTLLAGDLQHTNELTAAERLLRAGQERYPGDFWLNHQLGMLLYQRRALEEAVRYLTVALALRSNSAFLYVDLGNALLDKGDLGGAIRCYQAALRIDPKEAMTHNNLGNVLQEQGRLEDAIAEYQEAIKLRRDFAYPHIGLGNVLTKKGWLDDAIAEYQEAIRIRKDIAEAHNGLGNALALSTRLDEALAAWQEAIRLKPEFPQAHNSLGNGLADKGLLDDAIVEYRVAVRLQKDYPHAHVNLGNALSKKGRLDDAVEEYRQAIRLKKDFPQAHYALGNALFAKGLLDEAMASYHEAIRLNPDYAEVHCNLGHALKRQGRFVEALRALKAGHDLGSRRADWHYPSADWVHEAERLVELDATLAKVVAREVAPASAAERARLGWLCQQPYKQLVVAATRFYGEAFTLEPKLAEDLRAQHRYNAACAAALAGCGQGKDTANLDDEGRVRLRKHALTWLQAELAAWRKQLESNEVRFRPVVRQTMQHWLADTDFARVRDSEALAKLPQGERQDWQKLWADVKELGSTAGGKSARQKQ